MILVSESKHLLHAVVGRCEARNDDSLVGVRSKDVFKRLPHDFFGRGTALSFHVRGLAEHKKHALCADFRNAADVGFLAVDGRIVNLEVARDEHRTHWRGYRKRARTRHRVTNFDKLDFECSERYRIARRHHDEIAFFAAFVEFSFQKSDCERSAVNRYVFEFVGIVRDCADVVLVTVSEHDTAKFGYVLFYVGYVGYDCVDTGGFLARCERNAAIDDNHIVAALYCGHIFAHLAYAAEEGHLNCFCVFCHYISPLNSYFSMR